jgi:hypothetical protein
VGWRFGNGPQRRITERQVEERRAGGRSGRCLVRGSQYVRGRHFGGGDDGRHGQAELVTGRVDSDSPGAIGLRDVAIVAGLRAAQHALQRSRPRAVPQGHGRHDLERALPGHLRREGRRQDEDDERRDRDRERLDHAFSPIASPGIGHGLGRNVAALDRVGETGKPAP